VKVELKGAVRQTAFEFDRDSAADIPRIRWQRSHGDDHGTSIFGAATLFG
jgi:mannosyltransferase OCH1-like enzyme